MTDIQRYSLILNDMGEEIFHKRDNGEWVLYAEAVEWCNAKVQQAEQRGHERGMRTTGHYRVAYEKGKRDALAAVESDTQIVAYGDWRVRQALAAAVQRVEALFAEWLPPLNEHVIAAIKGDSDV